MTAEESLANQRVIQDLLDDIKDKATKIEKLEETISELKSLLRQINELSSVKGVNHSE
jgi:t-SNARE complex subunit (syntaxin)